ncbi:MAG: Gfo/Idh/MocA family oxidoreductase, partial [Chitinophagaceae bacterium]|nr:Gfo/Idh/MocA family oxidoreductase [Rubrivivax sp.]
MRRRLKSELKNSLPVLPVLPVLPISDRPIRFALVGCGRIASNHIEALRQHATSAQLAAVCDARPEALAAAVA